MRLRVPALLWVVLGGCSGSSFGPIDDSRLSLDLESSSLTLRESRDGSWVGVVRGRFSNPTPDTVFIGGPDGGPEWTALIEQDGAWVHPPGWSNISPAGPLLDNAMRLEPGSEIRFDVRLVHVSRRPLMPAGRTSGTFRIQIQAYSEPYEPGHGPEFPPGSALPFEDKTSSEIRVRLERE